MKVDELRVLEVDELGGKRLPPGEDASVGKLENSSQISKARHDIARIMTVLQERAFGIVAQVAPEAVTVAVAEPKAKKASAKAAEEPAEDTKPKRGAKAAKAKAEKSS